MVEKKTGHESLHSLLEEHRELMRQISEIRRWWSELDDFGMPKFGEMGCKVQELSELLAQHFADEEDGGYLAEALDAAPRFSQLANELQQQHEAMLARLDDFAKRLQASEPPFESWHDARDELETFLGRLRQHEQAENELAQSAFAEDVSAGD